MADREQSPVSRFPTTRMRRLRYHPAVRSLVQETTLSPGKLVLPLFVRAGDGEPTPIHSMPGHAQLPLEHLGEKVRRAADAGLGGIILFGIPAKNRATGHRYCQAGSPGVVGHHRRLLL